MKRLFSTNLVAILCITIGFLVAPNLSGAYPTSVNAQTIDAVTQASQSNTDWPMFHHDLTHTGYTTSAGPNTNQKAWNFTAAGGIWSSPAVANGIVFAGTLQGHRMYALNAITGSVLWNFTTGGMIYSSPAVANGVLYFGSNDRQIYALNATDGRLIWNYTTGGEVHGCPSVANDVVYICSSDFKLYALNAANGNLIWSYVTGDNVISSPAVDDGIVYFGS